MHLFLRYSQKTENVTGFVSDEVGGVCFQFGTRTESPACSNGCYSGILSGFHVHAGITDVGYVFPGHIDFSIISSTACGSGLAGTPSRWPSTSTNWMSGKYCAISLLVAAWYLLEATPIRIWFACKVCSTCSIPG